MIHHQRTNGYRPKVTQVTRPSTILFTPGRAAVTCGTSCSASAYVHRYLTLTISTFETDISLVSKLNHYDRKNRFTSDRSPSRSPQVATLWAHVPGPVPGEEPGSDVFENWLKSATPGTPRWTPGTRCRYGRCKRNRKADKGKQSPRHQSHRLAGGALEFPQPRLASRTHGRWPVRRPLPRSTPYRQSACGQQGRGQLRTTRLLSLMPQLGKLPLIAYQRYKTLRGRS
jgi:hypothetical protein